MRTSYNNTMIQLLSNVTHVCEDNVKHLNHILQTPWLYTVYVYAASKFYFSRECRNSYFELINYVSTLA